MPEAKPPRQQNSDDPNNTSAPTQFGGAFIINEPPTDSAKSLIQAGFWPRLAAITYESFAVMALIFCMGAIPVFLHGGKIPPGTLWYEVYLFLVPMLYFVLCWRKAGQTLGMLAWRIMLVDSHGKRVSLKLAVIRYFSSLLLGFGLLGILWMFIDSDGMAAQDRLSKTRVVRLPKQ